MIQKKVKLLRKVLQMAVQQGSKIAQTVQISRIYYDPQYTEITNSTLPKQYWYSVLFTGVDVNQMFTLQKKTRELGVRFDSCYCFPDKTRQWSLDWSFEFADDFQKHINQE